MGAARRLQFVQGFLCLAGRRSRSCRARRRSPRPSSDELRGRECGGRGHWKPWVRAPRVHSDEWVGGWPQERALALR